MKRIMIVDDSLFMRMILRTIITRDLHHEVVAEAANGVEAVAIYETVQPDLITLDITMPEMDGVTALREIKKKHPDAKVIMVSAMGQQSLLVEAISSGASDFIVKPFDKDRMKDAFDSVLKNKS